MGDSSGLPKALKEAAKRIAFRFTPVGAPTYPYPNVEPIQLATLVTEFERLRDTPGAVVEIGVARGMTTRFLCEHILRQGLAETTRYVAIDTFSSFVEADVAFEVTRRGKNREDIEGFAYNDYEVWKRNFAGFPFVTAIQADCSTFDYAALGPVKLAFLDVDLYLPTKNALAKLFDQIVDGGFILVDDVKDRNVYDGAYQAYMEFCAERGMTPEVIGTKSGVIRKPARLI
jgi:hypothetical protein